MPVTCTDKTGVAGDSLVVVSMPEGERTARLHVPASYDRSRGAMLVLNFHARGSNATQQETGSVMNPLTEDRGFLVAYPEGLSDERGSSPAWNAGICCNSRDDVGFVRALVERIGADYCLDPRRVYSTGLSMGGMLSYRLACELADTIAAIAPVAAGMLVSPLEQCTPSRPVPVLAFHGTSDGLVPYAGGPDGLGGSFMWPSVFDEMQFWRERNGCEGPPQNTYSQGDATCEEWSSCRMGSAVQLCTIKEGGHTWPGAVGPAPPFLGKTSQDLSASEWMIDFFRSHPM